MFIGVRERERERERDRQTDRQTDRQRAQNSELYYTRIKILGSRERERERTQNFITQGLRF